MSNIRNLCLSLAVNFLLLIRFFFLNAVILAFSSPNNQAILLIFMQIAGTTVLLQFEWNSHRDMPFRMILDLY